MEEGGWGRVACRMLRCATLRSLYCSADPPTPCGSGVVEVSQCVV